jgi:hypothetical protein
MTAGRGRVMGTGGTELSSFDSDFIGGIVPGIVMFGKCVYWNKLNDFAQTIEIVRR